MKLKLILTGFFSLSIIALPTVASAGFLDAFNNVNRSIQQTTSTIDNTKYNVQRVKGMVPKKKTPPPTSKPDTKSTPSSGSLSDKDRAALEKAKRAWVAAFKAEDWDALVDQYAEDAVILPPDEDAVSGHEAIRANFATDEDTSHEVFETIDMGGDDRIVYVHGSFSFTIKSKDTPPIEASGKYIEIWQKQPDGSWLITHDIWNADPASGE